jgi:uncharacterized protein
MYQPSLLALVAPKGSPWDLMRSGPTLSAFVSTKLIELGIGQFSDWTLHLSTLMYHYFMISRELSQGLLTKAIGYPVISVTGPRQSGKTTLIKDLFPNYTYTNLESPDIREFASSDPRTFLSQAKKMIIDEIQRVPELLSYVQVYVDEDSERRYVISGSQNLLISDKVSQSLAGRVFIANLFPLSLHELASADLIKPTLVSQMITGFYPKIYHESLDPSLWYKNYIQTYLEQDVRNIKNVDSLSIFQKFLGLLAGRTAQILNVSSIASDTGISIPTVQSWLSILEASYVIRLLPSYHNNWTKRIIKAPKIHFLDTGLVCSLLNINKTSELAQHPLVGSIFESFVFSEFVKSKENLQITTNMYYWRDKLGREVDLLLDMGNATEAIEVKYGQTIGKDFFTHIDYYKNLAQRDTKGVVIYGGEGIHSRGDFSVRGWKEIVK